ncbi:alkaline phosphatase [Paenibacillus chitinolyticus]|uniref:alkaline phosphatase n=1 Tax=Paenibacillus chitinolyticus TaxID=79263 RepID=UPI0026E4A48F|nr:alkaline phosphatase [Paenibacillus chitinolyticus]GKS12484.1 alkaline phosphatase [Paenibacillus chitinolyticus]
MKKIIHRSMIAGTAIALLPLTLANGALAAGTTAAEKEQKAVSKNVIVLIGDGMGPAQVSAGRTFSKNKLGKDHLELDSYYVGQATTYADRGEDGGTIVSGEVTDSASAGTAFATGNKTYNAAISVSNEDVSKPFASVIEASELAGKATGLVTTARITHATPAVYASHVRNRDNESAIASQYLNDGNVDVLFGGGKQFFVSKDEKGKRTDKTIIPDFEKEGYKVVYDKQGLASLDGKTGKALGLFGNSHVDYVLDRTNTVPNLAEMTSKAIDILSANPKGFTMMVEGGRIDHAGHANDLPSVVQEMLDFDAAVKVAMEFAKKDGNTSVVVTADHETGGLSLSRDNIYEINVDAWDDQQKSSELIGGELNKAKTVEDVKALVAKYTGHTDLTDDEAKFILAGDGSSYKQEGAFNAVMSKRYLVGWSGHGHSAVDVGVWAYGPIAEKVKGQIDNTEIARAVASVAGIDLKAATDKLQSEYVYPKFKITREGAVLYPARALAETLGAQVKWNGDSREVVLSAGGSNLSVNIDTQAAALNGQASGFQANIDNNVLYLPLEAFNKLTGKNLTWDALSERIKLK